MTAQVKLAGTAIASLVLGILGLISIGPLGAVPAVICGHMAMSRIKASGGQVGGDGLALAGLILGYMGIALMIILVPLMIAIAIPSFVKARTTSQKNACLINLRQIESAKEQWALETSQAAGAAVVTTAVDAYMKREPACPAGGRYDYNAVGVNASCTVSGHEL